MNGIGYKIKKTVLYILLILLSVVSTQHEADLRL